MEGDLVAHWSIARRGGDMLSAANLAATGQWLSITCAAITSSLFPKRILDRSISTLKR